MESRRSVTINNMNDSRMESMIEEKRDEQIEDLRFSKKIQIEKIQVFEKENEDLKKKIERL